MSHICSLISSQMSQITPINFTHTGKSFCLRINVTGFPKHTVLTGYVTGSEHLRHMLWDLLLGFEASGPHEYLLVHLGWSVARHFKPCSLCCRKQKEKYLLKPPVSGFSARSEWCTCHLNCLSCVYTYK